MPGPTWAVSPSIVCLPVNTISGWPNVSAIFWIADESANEVASVSEPAKNRSVNKTARCAPKVSALRKLSAAIGGPMVSTVTSPPSLSVSRNASSKANRSYGLMIVGTPWRMMVLVTGCTRICALSGTCLMQTTICMGLTPPVGRADETASHDTTQQAPYQLINYLFSFRFPDLAVGPTRCVRQDCHKGDRSCEGGAPQNETTRREAGSFVRAGNFPQKNGGQLSKTRCSIGDEALKSSYARSR
jgi:hypothetical protein